MRLARSLFYSAAGSHVETVLGVVTSIVIARSLGAKDYGAYALLLMWATLAQSLVNSGVTLGAQRFVAQARARGQPGIAAAVAARLRRAQWMKLVVALVVVAVALPIYGRVGTVPVGLAVLALVLAAITFRSQYMFSASVCKGAGDFRGVAIIAWAGSGANLVLVCAAGLLAPSMPGFLAAYVLSNLVFLLASHWASRRYFSNPQRHAVPGELGAEVSRHLKIVTVNAVLAQLASSQIEIFFLGMWAQTEEVGFFRLGAMLAGGVVGVVSGVVASVVLPYMSKAVAEGEQAAARAYVRLTRYLILLAVPVAALTVALSHSVVVTIYGPGFGGASFVLGVAVLALSLADINTPAQAYLLGAGRQYTVLLFTIVALVLKLTLGVFLIHRFGLEGAVASLSGTIVLISVAKSWLVRRYLKIGFPLATAARAAAFSVLAAAPAVLFTDVFEGVIAIGLGAVLFCPIYGMALLLGRCLSASEIASAHGLANSLPGPLRKAALAVLGVARPMPEPADG